MLTLIFFWPFYTKKLPMMGDFSWLDGFFPCVTISATGYCDTHPLQHHQRFHRSQTRSLPTAHLQTVPFVLQLARYNTCPCALPVRSQVGLLSRTVDPSGAGRCTFRPPVLLVSGVSVRKFVGDLKMTQEGDGAWTWFALVSFSCSFWMNFCYFSVFKYPRIMCDMFQMLCYTCMESIKGQYPIYYHLCSISC